MRLMSDHCKICKLYEKCIEMKIKLSPCIAYTEDKKKIEEAVNILKIADYKVFSDFEWSEVTKQINDKIGYRGNDAFIKIYDLNQILKDKLKEGGS